MLCDISIMATNAVVKGPTAERVASNVKALRLERRLTLAELADRMTRVGRPILVTGLSKLESGDRRVDVDDLVALAIALEVTPNRLLLTPSAAEDERISLSGPTLPPLPTAQVWKWATGEARMPDMFDQRDPLREVVWSTEFARENRPHDPPMDNHGWSQHGEALRALVDAAFAARDDGLSFAQIVGHIRWEFIRADRRMQRATTIEEG